MYKLFVGLKPAYLIKLFLDEIFHGLHVVVGYLLYVFHPLSVCLAEVAVDVAQLLEESMVEPGQLGQGQLTQRDEIFYLNPHAIAYERVF